MFDRIFDFIADVWEWLIPWVIMDPYEAGVVIRLGNFNRVIGPGFHLVWPLGFEEVKYETVVRQTAYLDVQSITTSDNKTACVSAIVTFIIVDIRKYLLDIDDGEGDMTNMVYGVISDEIESTTWESVRGRPFNNRVLKKSREVAEQFCGVEIVSIKWSDKTVARNLRLWND